MTTTPWLSYTGLPALLDLVARLHQDQPDAYQHRRDVTGSQNRTCKHDAIKTFVLQYTMSNVSRVNKILHSMTFLS